MITPQALSSFEWMFEKAIQEICCPAPDDICKFSRLHSVPSAPLDDDRKLVVLNISSFNFRLVIFIEFGTDPSTKALLIKILRSQAEKLEGQALLDAYAEIVNLICGTVNRRLGAEFRHVGMSTPFFLDSGCTDHLSMITPTATMPFKAVINESCKLNITVCVCVTDKQDLDLNIDRSEPEDSSNGELEFF